MKLFVVLYLFFCAFINQLAAQKISSNYTLVCSDEFNKDDLLDSTRWRYKNGFLRKNPFRQPHYLLLNLAMGGNIGGRMAKTQQPSKYYIDYVRLYQK